VTRKCLNRGSRQLLVAALLFIWWSAGSVLAQTTSETPQKRREVRRTFSLTKFYDTPTPLPAGEPGQLIRSEDFEEYDLADGVNAVRILYHSRSATGQDVAASGVVLFPDGKPPTGGWPVIAWAHGLNGVARQCAPSLARNVEHGPFLSMYVNLGYAVVATDYTGLGTNFRNAYADMQSNARDVIYSLPAARAAVPALGSRWVAIGTAEGGMAVVGLAELENEFRDSSYLGSVALSGLIDLQDIYAHAGTVSGSLPLLLAYGIKTVYPQFDAKEILTGKAFPLFERIGQGCSESQAAPEIPASELLKPNWQGNKLVGQYFSRNTAGQTPAYRPLLVISGDADAEATATKKIVTRLCRQGDQVQWEQYSDPDPGRVIGDSVGDQMAWIQARFADGPVPSNCSARR